MCVLVFKPKGVNIPSNDYLDAMYRRNPDGCGFATKSRIFKTTNYNRFMRELKKVRVDEDCIIHFRLATHGSVCDKNCHPFYSDAAGGTYFAHNGILNIQPIGNKTDSETAFITIYAPIIEAYGINSPELEKAVKATIGNSKFAFINGDEHRLFGNFTKIGGIYYSNTYWMQYFNAPRRSYRDSAYYRAIFASVV